MKKVSFIDENEMRTVLGNVRRPGRYVGNEVNSVHKEYLPERISLALAYPDDYEVGMSNLGFRILYHLLNEEDNVCCERVFMPQQDMENELKSRGLPLFSLESKRDISSFDIVGFSLAYELTYTSVLDMLSLSGIPVLSRDRSEEYPVIIAGGPCCSNPEPMSAFIDVFIIGDGESALSALVREYKRCRNSGMSKSSMLRSFAGMKGVYIPSLYKARYSGDGTFSGIEPVYDDVPSRVERSIEEDMDSLYYPVKQIVPLIRTVHDRLTVDIMRGCPYRCRFCQASSVNKPLRMRSVGRVREICRKTYENTGYESIALLSLSSVNYPGLTELIKGLTEDFGDKGVGISVPSLRVDEAFYGIPEVIAVIRKAGLTFAPESASKRLRKALGKDIDLDVLVNSVKIAYENGWRRIKLYFMAGFPSSDISEIEDIIGLSKKLSFIKRDMGKGPAEVRTNVNPFIPKPHTAFQWLPMAGKEDLLSYRKRLKGASTKKVAFDFHDIDQSILEACLARGDRNISEVVLAAWQKGAKRDASIGSFMPDAWEDAFKECGIDMEAYASRKLSTERDLPWGHLNAGVPVNILKEELLKSGLY